MKDFLTEAERGALVDLIDAKLLQEHLLNRRPKSSNDPENSFEFSVASGVLLGARECA